MYKHSKSRIVERRQITIKQNKQALVNIFWACSSSVVARTIRVVVLMCVTLIILRCFVFTAHIGRYHGLSGSWPVFCFRFDEA